MWSHEIHHDSFLLIPLNSQAFDIYGLCGDVLFGETIGLFLLFAFTSAHRKSEHNTAVVMKHDAPVSLDVSNGKSISYIPEGTTVIIEDEQKDNLQIVLPDGRKGWINKVQVERI